MNNEMKIRLDSMTDINEAEDREGNTLKKYSFYLTPMVLDREHAIADDVDEAILKAINEFNNRKMELPKKFKRTIKNIMVKNSHFDGVYDVTIEWAYAPLTTTARGFREAIMNIDDTYGINLYGEKFRGELGMCYTAEPIYTYTEN